MSALFARIGILAVLATLLAGPWLSLPGYSWLSDDLGTLGAQGMPNAWVRNGGFMVFGTGIAVAAWLTRARHLVISMALALYGRGIVGAGAFSAFPAEPMLPRDAWEDQIHRTFAAQAGICFAIAAFARLNASAGADLLSWIGLIAAVALPIAMLAASDWAGALQRRMFGISFVWLWRQFPVEADADGA